MSALVASTFPDEETANTVVNDVVQANGPAVEAWFNDVASPARKAFRSVLAYPVGTLLRIGNETPETVSSAVAVLGRTDQRDGSPAVTILDTHPVPTPAWELARASTVPGLVSLCPYPALEQVGLVWLGQDWDADGLTDAAAVLEAWRAETPHVHRVQAGSEATTLLTDMDEVADGVLLGLLVDLGFAVPEAGTDPRGLLRAIVQAAA